jgi:iron complex outermembrane recepter protein
MSELINIRDDRATIRWKLLTSVSAAALLVSVSGIGQAQADDNDGDRPLIWVELGGQLEQLSDSQEALSPPFMASISQPSLLKALNVQKPPAYAISEDAKITFQPENSDWVFSASVQYARFGAERHHHQQTANKTVAESFNLVLPPPYGTHHIGPKYYYPSGHVKFADGVANVSNSQFVLDFQAGKDVGLGLFGGRGSSVLAAGLRIAQFTSKSNVQLRAEPDVQYPTAAITSKYELIAFTNNDPIRFHDYAAMASARREFRGLGPSLSWNASAPVAGNSQGGEIAVDIGLNAAVLFGRQRASGHHRTTNKAYQVSSMSGGGGSFYRSGKKIKQIHFENHHGFEGGNGAVLPTAQNTNAASFDRARNVTVPNLGGFAGISMRYQDAKLSFGYRADFFFGAMDGGIDMAKKENRGFYGPFASVSVGIGG